MITGKKSAFFLHIKTFTALFLTQMEKHALLLVHFHLTFYMCVPGKF